MKALRVGLRVDDKQTIHVGDLELIDRNIYFQYSQQFLETKENISPFKLQFKKIAQTPADPRINFGLNGVFYDSLPDGWGLLLMNRYLKSKGQDFRSQTGLDLLALVGSKGMGALSYEPERTSWTKSHLDILSYWHETQKVLAGEASDVLAQLMMDGGSPGGARPKAIIHIGENQDKILFGHQNPPRGYQKWLVKFPSKNDALDCGIVEHHILELAKKVGIESEPSRLLSDSEGHSWFATKCFDRGPKGECYHMHSVAGLLEIDFRTPAFDYVDLMKVCHTITKGRKPELLKLFRLMIFNVAIGNRDDHSKNFCFLQKGGTWVLSPAYDMTFQYGLSGHHFTSINGKGVDVEKSDIYAVGRPYFTQREISTELERVLELRTYMNDMAWHWPEEIVRHVDKTLSRLS